MSPGATNSKLFFVLPVLALLYFGMQWLGASSMGGCRIFSPTRKTDRADFAMLVNRLSAAARTDCASGPGRKLMFEDADVVTPYLAEVAGPLRQCELVRITPVTLFTQAELEECGNLFVAGFSPPQPPYLEQGFRTDPIVPAYPWPVLDRWVSPDGRYGFTVYRHSCATLEDRKQ
jgi:hypothetical protein